MTNIEKISKETLAISRIYKPFFNRAISNEIQWTIVSLPSSEWAVKVFPNTKSPEEAVNLMWEAIFKANLIDDHVDPIDNWDRHIEKLSLQTKKLISFPFRGILLWQGSLF